MNTAITDESSLKGQSTDGSRQLFTGQTFFFSQTVPQRLRFIEEAKANGASITPFDKQADICLHDHARRNPPPGAVSYRYVELSVHKGVLENVEDHRITPPSRTGRPVGSVTVASKRSRQPFTHEDDQLLWNWIEPFRDVGGAWKGNEIYKQIAELHPHHTFQSWRDRYIKHTRYQNRSITARAGLDTHANQQVVTVQEVETHHSSPPTTKNESLGSTSAQVLSDRPGPQASGSTDQLENLPLYADFSPEEAKSLYGAVRDILLWPSEEMDSSWSQVAKENGRGPQDWRFYYEQIMLPEYKRRNGLDSDIKMQDYLAKMRREEQNFQKHLDTHIEAGHQHTASCSVAQDERSSQNSVAAAFRTPGDVDLATRTSKQPRQINGSQSQTKVAEAQSTQSQCTTASFLPDVPYHSSPKPNTQTAQIENASSPRTTDSVELSTHGAVSKRKLNSSGLHQITNKKLRLNRSPFTASRAEMKHRMSSSDESGRNAKVKKERTSESCSEYESDNGGPGNLLDWGPAYTLDDRNEEVLQEWVGECSARIVARRNLAEVYETDESNITAPREEIDHDSDSPFARETNLARLPVTDSVLDKTSAAEDDTESITSSSSWATTTSGGAEDHGIDTAEILRVASEATSEATSVQILKSVREELSEGDSINTRNSAFETAPEQDLQTTQDRHKEAMTLGWNNYDGINDNANVPVRRKNMSATIPDAQQTKGKDKRARLDTQVMVQLPLDTQTAQPSFSIPPPEGGWDDEIENDESDLPPLSEILFPTPGGITASSHNKTNKQAGQPNKRAGSHGLSDSQATGSDIDNDEVDTWLSRQAARQQKVHHGLPLPIIEEVLIQSLAVTSLDLKVASRLVEVLTSELSAIRYHLSVSLGTLSTTSKRYKKTISKTVTALIPANETGVWTAEDDRKLTGTNARLVEEVERKHGEASVEARFEYLAELSL